MNNNAYFDMCFIICPDLVFPLILSSMRKEAISCLHDTVLHKEQFLKELSEWFKGLVPYPKEFLKETKIPFMTVISLCVGQNLKLHMAYNLAHKMEKNHMGWIVISYTNCISKIPFDVLSNTY